jgi:hypothetical protein
VTDVVSAEPVTVLGFSQGAAVAIASPAFGVAQTHGDGARNSAVREMTRGKPLEEEWLGS